MFRAIVCTLALAVTPAVRAGELDREAAPATTPAPVAKPTPVAAATTGGSEMDRESPQSAHGWRWGGYYGPGWGWGGYSYGFRAPYFGYGFSPAFYYPYRPFGFYNGFYGGFGYGYPYFPAYYSPFVYRYWW